jgi:hypothetical protein
MSTPPRNEKEDEKREKEDEKRHEKTFEEKWRHNPVRVVTLAIILIWGGIVALIEVSPITRPEWWQGWSVFLAGTGIILLIKAAFRLRPEHRRPVGGTIIIGLILLAIGIGDIVGWGYTWPAILIIIGVILVLRFAIKRP